MSHILPRSSPHVGDHSVLVIDGDNGQSRSALAAVRALARASYRVVVATPARISLAAASTACSQRVPIPRSSNPDHADAVRAELDRGPYLTALPSSDASLRALSAPGAQFLDKHELGIRAAAAGLPQIADEVFPTGRALVAAAGRLDFPCVYKADSPSVNVGRASAPTDLLRLEHVSSRVIVQPYVEGSMSAVAGLVWGGQLVMAVHQRYLRTWPNPCGTASAAVTVKPDPGAERAVLALLEGYEGMFQAQFIGPHAIDLNPRVYGSMPLAVAAGINLPAALCDSIAGRPVATARAEAGIHYRWLEGDIRHVADRLGAGTMGVRALVRELAPRRHTAYSVVSIRDPGPFLARIRHAAAEAARR